MLHATVHCYDNKQYRELYGTPEAVKAAREGKTIPSGTVLTLIQYKAPVDAAGNPSKGANGLGHGVSGRHPQRRIGILGLHRGSKFDDKANYTACFQCHKPHAKQDFVISLARLSGQAPGGPVAMKTSPNDVGISGFSFGPTTLTIAPGRYVTWTNGDDSPHQITVAQSQERAAVLLKGQSHTQALATAGVDEYNCGLHPNMKGTIEVK